jgi:uncharacterized membrane protein
MRFSRSYIYAVAIAAVNLAVTFGLSVTVDQLAGINTFLAVVLGVHAAYQDPRVPVGKQ